MTGATSVSVAALLAGTLGAAAGCSYNNFVTYGPGRIDYMGSRIEYLDATPAPGAILVEGSTVELKVRVRYTLQRAPEGRLILWFTDTHGAPLPVDAVAVAIEQGVSVVDTVTRKVAVPATARDLTLHIGVAAGSETTAAGDLQLTYLVKRPG
jgi:hypothetical protein